MLASSVCSYWEWAESQTRQHGSNTNLWRPRISNEARWRVHLWKTTRGATGHLVIVYYRDHRALHQTVSFQKTKSPSLKPLLQNQEKPTQLMPTPQQSPDTVCTFQGRGTERQALVLRFLTTQPEPTLFLIPEQAHFGLVQITQGKITPNKKKASVLAGESLGQHTR